MDSVGSGNWIRSGKKRICEGVNKIDIFTFKQRGALIPGSSGVISWDAGGRQLGSINFSVDKLSLMLHPDSTMQRIWFDWTQCYYGGRRVWFHCPTCSTRVGVIYSGDKGFACRQCNDLRYACQSESRLDRQYRKIRKLRRMLGGSENLTKQLWLKPQGMHRETFARLLDVEKKLKIRLQVEMLVLFNTW